METGDLMEYEQSSFSRSNELGGVAIETIALTPEDEEYIILGED